MRTLRACWLRLGGLFDRSRRDREIAAELESHLQMHIEDNLRAGMTPVEARRRALIKLGGVEQTKEKYRDRRGLPWIESLWQDLRFGLRMLRKNPGFTAVAVLTLALGIGANTAVFSVINTVLLRPISAPEPDRVVAFMSTNRQGSSSLASEVKFNVWHEQTNVVQDVSAYRPGSFNLIGVDQPQKADGIYVTEDYFHLFGVPLAQGHSFTRDEEQPNSRKVVILSDAFWKTAFGGDKRIVGRTILLDGDSYQVVGILAANIQMEDFGLANEPFAPEGVPDVWVPFPIDINSNYQVHYFQAVGRLKPGITLDTANAQLQLATQEFRRKFPTGLSTSRGDVFSIQPLRDLLVKGVRVSLLILSAAVSFVLLIACANVASLSLAQSINRRHEFAIRRAVGASPRRTVRQLLTESMLLSVLASGFGLALGLAGIHTLFALNPYDIPRVGANASNIALDWEVLTFAICMTLITGVLVGLIPALQTSRMDLSASLKEGEQGSTGLRQNRASSLLVIGQTSLALLLLIGAALCIRTLIAVRSVNPGFDIDNVVSVRTTLDPRLAKASTISQIIQNVTQRLNRLPGVEDAAFTNMLPLEGTFNSLPITVVGRPLNAPSPLAGHGNSRFMTISSGYFDVLKIPLIRGRLFTDNDRGGTPGVAIVNQSMARKFWPDSDPLSAQIFIGKGLGPSFDEPARQIVGIVADVHDDELDRNPAPAVFIPMAQRMAVQSMRDDGTWIIRVRGRSSSLDAAIQSNLREAIGGLPVPPLRSMETVTVQSTGRHDFNVRLLTVFGFVALVIAAIGTYGLAAYTVRQRKREVAIRMTLGAAPEEVQKMLIGRAMRPVVTGIFIGLVAALGLTRFLSSLLFGVKPIDPVAFITVVLVLLGVAFLACYLPARMATKVDPMAALRHE